MASLYSSLGERNSITRGRSGGGREVKRFKDTFDFLLQDRVSIASAEKAGGNVRLRGNPASVGGGLQLAVLD